MKRLTIAVVGLLSAVLLSISVFASTDAVQTVLQYRDIKITLNGNPVVPRDGYGNAVEPFTIDGVTYLPVRAFADALGLGVDWDEATNTIVLTGGVGASTQVSGTAVYKVSRSYEYSDATIGDFHLHINDVAEISDTPIGKTVTISFIGTNISGRVTNIAQSVNLRAFQKSILLHPAETSRSIWTASRLGGEVTVTYTFYVNDLESPIEFEIYDAYSGGSQVAKATFVRA